MREIDRKFDEIVEFSGVDQFLDTPVKRYSSGMYVRLAFAVAAHLEPEILIVDEVLSVGDASFQKKCLGKISDVVHGGRTVLFVSHNMSAVGSLCDGPLVLERGRLTFDGPAPRGSRATLGRPRSARRSTSPRSPTGGAQHEYGRLCSVSLFDSADQPRDNFAMGEAMVVEIEAECSRRLCPGEVLFSLNNMFGVSMHYFVSSWEGLELDLRPGRHRFRVTIPEVLVFPGRYTLNLS